MIISSLRNRVTKLGKRKIWVVFSNRTSERISGNIEFGWCFGHNALLVWINVKGFKSLRTPLMTNQDT